MGHVGGGGGLSLYVSCIMGHVGVGGGGGEAKTVIIFQYQQL